MGRLVWIAPLVILACRSESALFIQRSWTDDETAVVAVTDVDGNALEGAPRVVRAGEALGFEIAVEDDFRILVELFVDAGELERCGAAYGGAGTELPEPVARLDSGPVVSGQAVVQLLETEAARTLPLNFACDEIVPPTLCEQVMISAFPMEAPDVDLFAMAAVSDERGFTGGTLGFGVAAIDSSANVSPVDGVLTSTETVSHLVWDGADVVLGSTTLGLFQLDVDGTVVARATTPTPPRWLSIGRDQTALLLLADRRLFSVAVGSLALTEVNDAPSGLETIHVISADRIVAAGNGKLHYFDGTGWTEEFQTEAIDATTRLAGDPRLYTLAGAVLVRDDASGTWRSIGAPFERTSAFAIDVATDGSVLVGGEFGALALYDGSGWCQTDGSIVRNFRSLDFAPGGKTGWVVTSDAGGAGSSPALVRVTLP